MGALLAAAVLLGGCAAPQSTALRTEQRDAQLSGLPARHLIPGVPFVPQTAFHCGPATLSMVAQHAGLKTNAQQLASQVFVPGLQGSLQAEMLTAPRRQGLMSIQVQPTLRDVLQHVASGTPVIVLQNLALPIKPLWHYAVVIGYDIPANQVILHSGTDAQKTMPFDTFEHTWARSGHWAMIVARPDSVPENVGEPQYVQAAAALERTNLRAAHRAYIRGMLRWPDNRYLQFGLANTYVAQQQPTQARRVLERLVEQHPDWGDAWNNLAILRADLGDRDGAVEAIDRAMEIGGAHIEAYKATRVRLAKQLFAK